MRRVIQRCRCIVVMVIDRDSDAAGDDTHTDCGDDRMRDYEVVHRLRCALDGLTASERQRDDQN
jgi:hypothetical protein